MNQDHAIMTMVAVKRRFNPLGHTADYHHFSLTLIIDENYALKYSLRFYANKNFQTLLNYYAVTPRKNCDSVHREGVHMDGVYLIHPNGQVMRIYCVFNESGSGDNWLVRVFMFYCSKEKGLL